MRKIILLLGALAIFAGILYFFRAQKALRAEQARMYLKYQRNEMSKAEFEAVISNYTFWDVLKNPKVVGSVD